MVAISKLLLPSLNNIAHSPDWPNFLLYLDELEKLQRGVQDTSSNNQDLYQAQGKMKLINQLRALSDTVKNEFANNKQDDTHG